MATPKQIESNVSHLLNRLIEPQIMKFIVFIKFIFFVLIIKIDNYELCTLIGTDIFNNTTN